jgi:hypothetical protein
MRSNTLTAVLCAGARLLGLSYALPTASEDLVPRACTTRTPDVLLYWDKNNPNIGTPGGTVRMERTGGPGTNTIKTGFTFNNIPQGATGCMLQFELPPVTSPNQYATGSNNFDLFSVDRPITYNINWNNQPTKTTKWASMNVPEWITTQPFKTILMSNTCASTMSFEIELSDWQQSAGKISFLNTGFKPVPIRSGFSLIYNC